MVLLALIKAYTSLVCLLWSTEMCILPKTSYVFYSFSIYVLSIVAVLEAEDGFGRGDSKYELQRSPPPKSLLYPSRVRLSPLLTECLQLRLPVSSWLCQTFIPCGPHTYGSLASTETLSQRSSLNTSLN